MKVIVGLILLLGLLGACTPDPNIANHQATRPDTVFGVEKIYTISCEGPSGWVAYQTKRHPYNSYGVRGGVWAFLTTDGKSVWASNCIAVHKGPTHP